eukprot:9019915-Pyramimonas_sp.AAC.1
MVNANHEPQNQTIVGYVGTTIKGGHESGGTRPKANRLTLCTAMRGTNDEQKLLLPRVRGMTPPYTRETHLCVSHVQSDTPVSHDLLCVIHP